MSKAQYRLISVALAVPIQCRTVSSSFYILPICIQYTHIISPYTYKHPFTALPMRNIKQCIDWSMRFTLFIKSVSIRWLDEHIEPAIGYSRKLYDWIHIIGNGLMFNTVWLVFLHSLESPLISYSVLCVRTVYFVVNRLAYQISHTFDRHNVCAIKISILNEWNGFENCLCGKFSIYFKCLNQYETWWKSDAIWFFSIFQIL